MEFQDSVVAILDVVKVERVYNEKGGNYYLVVETKDQVKLHRYAGNHTFTTFDDNKLKEGFTGKARFMVSPWADGKLNYTYLGPVK